MRWWRGPERTRGRRAAILVPSLFPGDATGNDALAMRAILRASGWDARIFAEGSDPALGARPAGEAAAFARDPSSLLVYHQSTWWERGPALLRAARGARFVRDHNVTPASFFRGVHDDFVRAAAAGAEQRAVLAREPGVRFLAASATNAAELVALGADPGRIDVLPPFHRAEELAATAADEAALRRWTGGGTTALFVGRLAPNKGHRRLLRILAAWRELLAAPLRLRLVGHVDPRFSRWRAVIDGDIDRLGLVDRVEIVGGVDEAELKSAYLTAHVLLCASEHEGFCVPLVEAARLGVPVVAVRQAAIAETLGRGGLVLEGSDDELAAAVHRVVVDAAVRERIVAAQRAEYDARFAPDVLRGRFLALVGGDAGPGRG